MLLYLRTFEIDLHVNLQRQVYWKHLEIKIIMFCYADKEVMYKLFSTTA